MFEHFFFLNFHLEFLPLTRRGRVTFRKIRVRHWFLTITNIPFHPNSQITPLFEHRGIQSFFFNWIRDELISDVLLWAPTYGRVKAGRTARTYIQQLCVDTGCSPEDLPEAINDGEKWRERVRDIRANSTTWWWYLKSSGLKNLSDLPLRKIWHKIILIWGATCETSSMHSMWSNKNSRYNVG